MKGTFCKQLLPNSGEPAMSYRLATLDELDATGRSLPRWRFQIGQLAIVWVGSG